MKSNFDESGMATTSSLPSGTVSNGRSNHNEIVKAIAKKIKRPGERKTFDVELIMNHQESNNKVTKYEVKWWDAVETTWEPVEEIDCYELIAEYFQKKSDPKIEKSSFNRRFDALKRSFEIYNKEELLDLARLYFTNDGHVIPDVRMETIDNAIKILSKIPPNARDSRYVAKIKSALLEFELRNQREKQLIDLKTWEDNINMICPGTARIKVFNSVDLDGPPMNFSFDNKYTAAPDVIIPDDPLIGCKCKWLCMNSECCSQNSGKSNYSTDGLLKVPRGTPIYECNKRCLCPANCGNRVLQKGRKIPVAIFKTGNGCGWGLKALQNISKGEFVTEYVGEVISTEEAENRGKIYDLNGTTYLFDLDFYDKKDCEYTVDAKNHGNESRFINHSCNPNLAVFAVFVDCLVPDIPRLGLFTSRAVKENEELTFDYLCQPVKGKNKKRIPGLTNCKCGARNCRKYLF